MNVMVVKWGRGDVWTVGRGCRRTRAREFVDSTARGQLPLPQFQDTHYIASSRRVNVYLRVKKKKCVIHAVAI